jgi:hypothetical protein
LHISGKKRILLLITRHGERSDKVLSAEIIKNLISIDPQLTEKGK